MAQKPVDILKQLSAFWTALPTPKRIALLFAVVSVMLAVGAVAVIGSKVQYGYLYTSLDTKDAAAIAQKLNELKVPHKIDAGGTAIRVPEEQVHSLRLELAGNGLPSGGGIGNEIFDQTRLGATEFEQEVNLRRALEGELSRSISTIAGVDAVRVHLVIPKRRLFAAKSEGASASVMLTLRNQHDFGRHEVAAIVHLVSMAVPNLRADRVSVVDSKGATLHRPEGEQQGLVASEGRSAEMREAERRVEERVRTLLERAAGPNAVDVRVKLDVDSATRERTEEHYDPTRNVLRSEHAVEELTNAEGESVAGIPGAQTNLPDVEPSLQPTAEDMGGNVARRSHTRNWEVDRVVEKILLPAGDVKRLSIAVLVDGKYEMREGESVYVPRTLEELEVLRNVVKGAVGFDAERGDTIELQSARFHRDRDELGTTTPALPEPEWKQYLLPGLAGLGVLLLLSGVVLVWRTRRERLAAIQRERALQAELEGEERHRLMEAEARLLEQQANGGDFTPEFALQRRKEALEIAASDPATAAVVLRDWLTAPDVASQLSEGTGIDG